MMMVMGVSGNWFRVAILLVAMLAGRFELDGGVGDAMLLEFFAEGSFDFYGVTFGDDVESGVVMMAVHAPDMDVMDVFDAGNFEEVGFEVGSG